jgi:hypothetical protein
MVSYDHSSHTLDEVCRILSHRCRRQLLTYLSRKEGDVADLDEIVTYLSAEDDEAIPAEQIRLSLVHIHLPKLADYGTVEYDRRNGDARYRGGMILEDFLEVIPSNAST